MIHAEKRVALFMRSTEKNRWKKEVEKKHHPLITPRDKMHWCGAHFVFSEAEKNFVKFLYSIKKKTLD